MKNTALKTTHEALGAKMVDFAGYYMPVQYQDGVKIEHETVRTKVGVFDVSHMGEFLLKGENALDLIQKVTTNDASKIAIGQAQYTCMPNEDGGIVDDLLVYRLEENEYMLVVNASNIEKDWNWISKFNDFNVEMTDMSEEMSLLAVQGPLATQVLQKLTEADLVSIKYYRFSTQKFAGKENVILSATGYTGAGGFEVYFRNEDAEDIWNAIFEAGKEEGIKPIGLAARDTLRLEMGFCLYGNDIDDTTSPLEAGLGWITKFTKDFVNSENIKRQKEEGITKKLVGFELLDRGIPRKDYEIVDAEGNSIGRVTSGTMSPSLNKAIGLGYVTKEFSKVDSEIFIQVRKKALKAVVRKLPFYSK
ncbi:MAG: glycine cleavage system aminomethyltransferase GcvT [Flavobacteriales bacterium]|jgi:aminomethyltransferase|nr:glycine cleavage system aminomethyltransferase GcvT [Flavobacteriales bacterium]